VKIPTRTVHRKRTIERSAVSEIERSERADDRAGNRAEAERRVQRKSMRSRVR
jgi:hypothetical protein